VYEKIELGEEEISEILKLSITHLLVLQRLAVIKRPIVRYKLMQEIREIVGKDNLSTAKFYRILEKLFEIGLVDFRQVEDKQDEYYISEEGMKTITWSRGAITQFIGLAFNFLEEQIEEIKKFAGGPKNEVLIVDFIDVVDIQLINEVREYSKSIYLLTSEDKFPWFKENIEGLNQTRFTNGVIREPDEFFELIVVTNGSNSEDPSIYKEMYRVIKPGGMLLLIEIENPLGTSDHFFVDLILEEMIPLVKLQADFKAFLEKIEADFKWKETQNYDWRGLHLKKLIKE
jgi:DNA-binding PadR family transcriptional regulator